MNKQERALREQALLTAALNCFATERWEDVSVARIARLAGVAKGTVYLHFTSKDEICARLAQDFHDQLGEKYQAISGNGYSQLKQLIKITFDHYHQQKHYRHVVQNCQREHFLTHLNPELAESLKCVEVTRRHKIAQALTTGANDKSLKPDAVKNLTGVYCTLTGALNHFYCESFARQQRPVLTKHIQQSPENHSTVTQAQVTQPPVTQIPVTQTKGSQNQTTYFEEVTGYILKTVVQNTKVNTNDLTLPTLEVSTGVQ